MLNWYRRWQKARRVKRSLRDLLLPTVRMHSAALQRLGRPALTDRQEEQLIRNLIALRDPTSDASEFARRVRVHLDNEKLS